MSLGTTDRSLWFGITMSVSTRSFNSAIPSCARFIRFGPSNIKGLVTMPTVKAPKSLAISATIGAAPVPVPPPIPAVTKIISASDNASKTVSRSSSIALLPVSGLAPAPRPLVNAQPTCMRELARHISSACKSVLMVKNSTPLNFASIMRLIALPPAPPTPTTFIFAVAEWLSSNANLKFMALLPFCSKSSSCCFGFPIISSQNFKQCTDR